MKRIGFKIVFLSAIFLIPLYMVKVSFFNVPTNVLEVFAILVAGWALFTKRKMLPLEIKKIPLPVLLGSFCLIAGASLSILFNQNQTIGLGILKGWFLIPMLFSFSLYLLIDRLSQIEDVFKIIFISTSFIGAISIAYELLGLVTYDNRLSAFYLSPNHLAMYLAPGIFFGCYFTVKSFSESKKKFLTYLSLLIAILIPLYFTYSYGAWLAIFFSFLITVSMFLPTKKHFLKTIFFFGLNLSVLFLSQINNEKLISISQNFERSSFASRITIWQVSSKLIMENPIIGIGPGNFQSAYLSLQKYFPPYLEWAIPQPHNVFLAFWLQTGLIGFFGFLVILYFIFKTFLTLIKDKKSAAFAAPLLVFFLYTVIHGLIDTTYWKNDLSFLFWINIFLLLSLQSISAKKTSCID